MNPSFRILRTCWACLLMTLWITGFLGVWWKVDLAERQKKEDLLRQSRLVAESLNLDRLRMLTGNETDLEKPEYLQIKSQLADIKQVYDQCRFVYLLGCKTDNQVFFFVDNEPADSKDYSPPGQVYAEVPEGFRQVFRNGNTTVAGPYNDRWGCWVTGLTPIKDPRSGALLAVLGMDIAAGLWNRDLARAGLPVALLTLVLSALLLAGAALQRRRASSAGQSSVWSHQLESSLAMTVGLALTLFASWTAHQNARQKRNEVFIYLAESRIAAIAQTLHAIHEFQLEGLGQFCQGNPGFTLEEFNDYAKHLVKNSAVHAWEWIPAVSASEKDQLEAAARTAGQHDFAIWQRDAAGQPQPADRREVYYPVLYAAPLAGNEKALGYDLGSEPARRAALEEAVRTGFPAATSPVRLVQEMGDQLGLLIFRPVFDEGSRLLGFALAALRSGILLENANRDKAVYLEVKLLDNGKIESLTSKGNSRTSQDVTLSLTRPVVSFGRTFFVTAYGGDEFMRLHPVRASWWIALCGVVLTAALVWSLSTILRRRAALEELVAARTAHLQESASRLRAITDSTRDAILMIDPHGRISFCNPAAERIFGYSREELLGQDLHRLLASPRYRERHQEAWEGFRKTGLGNAIGKTLELHGCHKQGHEFPLELSLSAIQLADGWHAVGLLRDITERKRAEEQLLETNRSLEATTARANTLAKQAELASIAKSEFLANMSHEIRTPMNGVIGMTNLLLDTELTPDQKRYAETVRTCGQSLLLLINDILDFSKIEAGKLELAIQEFDLQSFLHDLSEVMAVKAAEKDLEFLCAAAPDVPTLLRGDPGRLKQVLINLAGNALKFTQSGEVSVRVFQECQSEGEVCLRFSVRDTGMGIPADKLGLLFEKFSQVDASITRSFGGTGLGLAISKRLAELMGGEIGVNSQVGQGSEFWFTARFSLVPERQYSPPPKAHLHGIRVLVVDDNATNREILRLQLQSWGMQPTETTNGSSALEHLQQALEAGNPFQLAILDMQMPGMDGATLGQIIHADARLHEMILILMTSLGKARNPNRLPEIDFAACLHKPVRKLELYDSLVRALGKIKQPVPAPVAMASSRRPARIRSGARVLLAEDNLTNQQVAMGILQMLGLAVDTVANGQEAVQALSNGSYDLVLMDVQMPMMDGLEATRRIRQDEGTKLSCGSGMGSQLSPAFHGIPIIAMTAHVLPRDREQCLQAGMNDYVSKPVDSQALARVLEKWLPAASLDGPSPSSPPLGEEKVAGADASAAIIFDRTALLVRLMDDEELMLKVQECFLNDWPQQLQSLKELVASRDTKLAGKQAHKMKGAAANVSGEALREIAARLEQAGSEGNQRMLENLLPELENQFNLLKKVMEAGHTKGI